MTRHGSRNLYLTTPLRRWFRRVALGVLVVAAGALIVLDRSGSSLGERIRTDLQDLATPVLDAVSVPVGIAGEWIGSVGDLYAVEEENERLRRQITALEMWRGEALRLSAENRTLRDLLNTVSDGHERVVTARVIADSGGAFVESLLVNGGSRDGVRKGLAVTNEEGLVGRVVETGERSARVLLVIDRNSRIPVIVERSRDRAVLVGDNTRFAVLAHLPLDGDVEVGDRIVTSGHAGVLPPGIPVGEVVKADESSARVRPFVNWNRVEFVRIVDYTPRGLIGGPELVAAGGEQ